MWPNPQESADLVTFTEKTHNWKQFFAQWLNVTATDFSFRSFDTNPVRGGFFHGPCEGWYKGKVVSMCF